MKLNELQVDVQKLLARARSAGWGCQCVNILWSMAGQQMPSSPKDWDALPMESVGYVALSRYLDGYMRLAAVDALVGPAPTKRSGVVLLAMAKKIFLPHVPEGHAARQPTEALLAALSGYLIDDEAAEHYIGAAYRYRSQFGTSCTARGDDPEFEMLFEAMPAEGLDSAIGDEHWALSLHWRSFGRFLASGMDEWKALEALEEAARDAELVTEDSSADAEARGRLDALIDGQRDEYIEEALFDYDGELKGLVDGMLETLCVHLAAQG